MGKLGINVLENWPPYSPDINIIEIVWALMKRKVEKLRPKTLDELKHIVQKVWDDFNPATINSLIQSIRPRLVQLIKNGGRQVHSYEHDPQF